MSTTRRDLLKFATAGLAPALASGQSFLPGIPNVGVKADSGPLRTESAVGALMPWADVLWAVTYVSSRNYKTGSGTGLYAIDERLNIQQRHVSNGVYANRLVHKESNQVIIGPYVIDMKGNIRLIQDLANERLTATMIHLTDPANRVYFQTMEGLFYEMDIGTLKATVLYDLVKEFNITKPPHFKGGCTGQGRVVVANNTYTAWNETQGQLAEWDGKKWNIISRKPHMEAAARANMGNAVFATGWDEASALFHVLINGTWRRYRLPKASHTFDQYWQTEWTRIREAETERFLMDCHGMFYELSPMIFEDAVWGVNPICTHLRIIPDFCSFRGLFVMAGNENTPNNDANPVGGQPQSGIWFGKTDDLWRFGKPKGWGGPWRHTALKAGEPSDPFLMTGFEHKVLHLKLERGSQTRVAIEVDFLGHGAWEKYETVLVGAGEYRHHVFPTGFSAHWVRLVTDADCTITAEFMYT
ncbi:MAG: hypothetical protein AAB225_28835 [Acidobacteriota bacterium]